MDAGSEFDELHERTKSILPNNPNKPIKSSHFWAAVLHHNEFLEGEKAQDDFLWIKCNKKTSVNAVQQQYEKTLPPDSEFMLRHRGQFPELDETMKKLDWYNDKLVVFEALLIDDERLKRTRSPLKPKSANIRSSGETSKYGATPKKTPSSKVTKSTDLPRSSSTQFTNTPRTISESAIDSDPPNPREDHFVTPQQPLQQDATPRSTSGSEGSSSVALAGLPSQRVADPKLNLPFLHYLDWYFERHRGWANHLSLSYVIDHAWDSWLNLEAREKREHQQKVSREMSSSQMPWSEEAVRQAWVDAKPVVAGAADTLPKDEEIKAEMDFKDDFGPVGQDTQTSQLLDEKPKVFQLQEVVANASLEVLESTVEKATEWLNILKKPMLDKVQSSPEASQWLQQIERLQAQAVRTRTIIGVVGNTGAGKSSVINAMLDEERLVPTNTMRACTAVVTELSYNYSEYAYRAEIEFITADDWRKELTILFKDLIDDNGAISREIANEDSDAAMAYAKIKAVYPKKTKEDIAKSSIEAMMQEVSRILGQTKKVEENDSLFFYKKLQQYIDSKEKTTDKDKDKDKKKEPKEMGFWPLIKVVRIYVKSPALETGAIIVDLPGVHDANAARAAVAEGYMKQCSGLWIVAPSIRAVDDKAAKNLLGESFKRQLKMDGGFNAVSFICSKTDDISLSEATDSLGLESVNGPLWEDIDRQVKIQKSLKGELSELQETKATFGEILHDCDDQLETWEDLRSKAEDGDTVYPPRTKKRKASMDSQKNSAKKIRRSDDDDYAESASESDGEEASEDYLEEGGPREPLTVEQIVSKIAETKQTKKEARCQRADIDAKLKDIRGQIANSKTAESETEAVIAQACIAGRNDYSRGAIQQDFAAGIRELDQEIAAEEDADGFDPEADARDYDEVARSLPVFCVSSRAYQKLSGRLKKDPKVPGFTTTEQTEIPALQAHCKQLTISGRVAACKRFMTNLSQLLNSLRLWAASDGSGNHLSPEQKEIEAKFLTKSLRNLESALEKLVESTCRELNEELSIHIYDKFEVAINAAKTEATQISAHWGWPVNRENRAAGGYHWATYKAICRRDGVYSNGRGPHDLNGDLIEPMMKHIASGWERVFTRRTPAVTTGLSRNSSKLLKVFHEDVAARATMTGVGIAGISMLDSQLQNYENIFAELSQAAKKTLDESQRNINREFVPTIKEAMVRAYKECVDEHGPGSFKRMKSAMENHVATELHAMYNESCGGVQKMLKRLVSTVREQMENAADEIYAAIHRDYRSALGGGDLKPGEVMPKWQRDMRAAVLNSIDDGAERLLRVAMGLEPEEPDNFEGPQTAVKEEDAEMDDLSMIPLPTPLASDDECADLPENSIGKNSQGDRDEEGAHPKRQIKSERTNEGLQDASNLPMTHSTVPNETSNDKETTTPIRETDEQRASEVEMQENWLDAPAQSPLNDVHRQGLASPSTQLLHEERSSQIPEDSGIGFAGLDDASEQESTHGDANDD